MGVHDKDRATPLRALYVEDNTADGDLAARALARANPPILIDVVHTVADALTRLTDDASYDWVLFDLNLPDGDGLQVLRHIKAQRLPMVTLTITGTGDERAVIQALKMGVDDYIIKTGDYLERLHQHLMDARERTFQTWRPFNSQVRVLYVEDSEQDAALTAHHLSINAPHVLLDTVVAPFADLYPRLDQGHFDVLLLDFRLDTLDAFEIIKHHMRGDHRDAPIVIITGHGSEDIAARVLRMGVTDYLIKDSNYLQRLPSVLESACVRGQLQHERKRLQRSEAQLLQLTRQVPGAIVLFKLETDGSLHPVYASDALSKVQGLSLQDLSSDVVRGRVHPEDQNSLSDCIDKAARARTVSACEYRMRVDPHGWRWFETQMSPEPQTDGTTLLYCYTFDITERRQMHQMAVATQTAIKANQAKTEFLSHMSHELRTPLNAVLGFAQLLKADSRHPLTDNQVHQVKLIEQAGQHLLQMISEVLNLARIEAGEISLMPKVMPLEPLCTEAMALLQPMAQATHIRMHLHLPDGAATRPLLLFADPVRVKQVVVNLLSNAVKYNKPQGEVHVTLLRQDNHVVLQVRDTGIGMTATQQSHLFEPFNRLGADRSGIEGTGIGLVIVRKLVELMGGSMHVHSVAGEGSLFEVILPASPTDLPHVDAPVQVSQPATEQASQQVILYAEDDPINVELVRQILSLNQHYILRVATCGADAIAAALAEPPDLLLLDMHLGDMDGISVSDALREDPRLRHVPRIALSANALPEQIQRAREHGFAEYLTKPLNVGRFLASLAQHLAPGSIAP